MSKLKDPVILSGGSLGGEVVEGTKWKVNTEKEIQTDVWYRRLIDDGESLTSDKAVYIGKSKTQSIVVKTA